MELCLPELQVRGCGYSPIVGVVLTGVDLECSGICTRGDSSQSKSSRVSAKVSRPRKVFVLINNANPILDKDSPLYREVREAGWEVTEDGWEFSLRRAKSALAF